MQNFVSNSKGSAISWRNESVSSERIKFLFHSPNQILISKVVIKKKRIWLNLSCYTSPKSISNSNEIRKIAYKSFEFEMKPNSNLLKRCNYQWKIYETSTDWEIWLVLGCFETCQFRFEYFKKSQMNMIHRFETHTKKRLI